MNSTKISDVTKIQRQPIPIVAPGAGPELAIKWATRLAERWVSAIDLMAMRDNARSKVFLRSAAGDMPGNEKAAAKWASRFRKACGSSIISTFRTRFHRGSGTFYFDVIGRYSIDTQMIYLGVYRWAFEAHGPGRKSTAKCHGEIAQISQTAIVDIIRFGSAHTCDDVLSVVASAWREIAMISAITARRRAEQCGDSWAIPVNLAASAPVVLIAAGPREHEDAGLLRIHTIILRDEFCAADRVRIDTLDRALAAEPDKVFGVIDEVPEEISRLVEGVRNLRRKS